ncbi:hypothetical protein FV219_00290 [Methylobacterium sp. WL122]|nr:hypothetical protein FV219_00290 [Methylobacterium sp. WL122]
MSERYSHLLPDVRVLVDRSRQERIEFVQSDQWIGYPAANAAMDRLESLLTQARSPRMESGLLVGNAGNGTTTILETFAARHGDPQRLRDAEGRPSHRPLPVMVITIPREAGDAAVWTAILDRLRCAPPRKAEALKPYACAIMDQMQVRMLILDEVHSIASLRPSAQRDRLRLIAGLADDLRLAIVAAGNSQAQAVLANDPQTAGRFTPFVLPRWQNNQDFRDFLASYERLLPLPEPLRLTEQAPLEALLAASGGILGHVVRILRRAATAAIRDGRLYIDLRLIEATIDDPFGRQSHRTVG